MILAAGLFLVPSVLRAAEAEGVKSPSASNAAPAAAVSGGFESSVVKVFSTMRYPDLYRPWTKDAPRDMVGSGVVIEGKRILSNAHLALYASQVQIQANQAGDKLSATVEFLSPGMDLAILKLDDESFFDTHPPIPRASVLPEIKEAVMAYGFPKGGSSLSITKGIVSRIEFAAYNYQVMGLRIQIDAAINPGNSGGPVMSGNKMIGLAFSRLGDAENIGYIIPNEEIDLFLQDVADGHYDGKPALFDTLQTLENPALRAYLKLDKSMEGIVVHEPFLDGANSPLKEWDVISKIGDTPVDNQGMIRQGDNLRLRFSYLVQKLATNGTVPLTVIRESKELRVNVPVRASAPQVFQQLNGAYPSYFVYGPMVFSSATKELLGSLFRDESDSAASMLIFSASPIFRRIGERPAFENESLVFVSSPFFPHKLAKGYSNPSLGVVKTVNNISIKNLPHLVEVLRDCKDEFIVIEFFGRSSETLVFPRAAMAAATEEILTDNGVRSQGTADTMAVWNAKPGK